MKQEGFILIVTLLLLLLLMGGVGLALAAVSSYVRNCNYAAEQMKSMILAERGVEAARIIIAERDLNQILAAKNIPGSGSPDLERNPVRVSDAITLEPEELESECDGGFSFVSEGKEEIILVRISNNPGEPWCEDRDGKVIVRSMGIIPNRLLETERGDTGNQVTILEAWFRKESFFHLPSPLVLADQEGFWSFAGCDFKVKGGELSSIALLGPAGPEQMESLQREIKEDCPENFDGPPCLVTAVPAVEGASIQPCLSSELFWNHFQKNLNIFAHDIKGIKKPGGIRGLARCSGPANLSGDVTGVLVTSGNVVLDGRFDLDGLLIHLGGGILEIAEKSRISGAVLYISGEQDSQAGLEIRDHAEIVYDPSALELAQAFLPVTHLGTRVIF